MSSSTLHFINRTDQPGIEKQSSDTAVVDCSKKFNMAEGEVENYSDHISITKHDRFTFFDESNKHISIQGIILTKVQL